MFNSVLSTYTLEQSNTRKRLRNKLQEKERAKDIVEKPLLLVMVIANCEDSIEKTLNSLVFGENFTIIDALSICDTGTDQSSLIIEKWAVSHNLPYKIHKLDDCTIDYAISLSKQTFCAEYLFLLQQDVIFEGSIDKRILSKDLYSCLLSESRISFEIPLIIRQKVEWRCSLPIYGVFSAKTNYTRDILTCKLISIADEKKKFLRDEQLLLKSLNKGNKVHCHFWLAWCYFRSNYFTLALRYYKKCTNSDGWTEECYYSLYGIGRCNEEIAKLCLSQSEIPFEEDLELHPLIQKISELTPKELKIASEYHFDRAEKYYGIAHGKRKFRSEALFSHAVLLRKRDKLEEAYEKALRCTRQKYCDDTLFVDNSIVEYAAEYELLLDSIGLQKKDSIVLWEKLMKKSLPENIKELVVALKSKLPV